MRKAVSPMMYHDVFSPPRKKGYDSANPHTHTHTRRPALEHQQQGPLHTGAPGASWHEEMDMFVASRMAFPDVLGNGLCQGGSSVGSGDSRRRDQSWTETDG
jgi:hypothetical protein